MLGKCQTWRGLADIAWTALASHAVCTLVLQSGGQVQRRTECEAAGRKKRHFFSHGRAAQGLAVASWALWTRTAPQRFRTGFPLIAK